MNIFKVLANGDGTINEPNISAFLGYLLDPYQDHGLGFEFLDRFLKKIEFLDLEDFISPNYEYEILFEQAFRDQPELKNEIVDIVILCFENKNPNTKQKSTLNLIQDKRELKYIFLIENKVNNGSKSKDQLRNQFLNTIKELKIDENSVKVISVFITPDNRMYNENFSSFTENEEKVHFIWKKKNGDDKNELYGIIKEIIRDEGDGEIEAINEYTRHTIISFLKFIESDFKSQLKEKIERKRSNDGSYTKKYIELNNKTKIFEKLDLLRTELVKRNPEFEIHLSSPNLTKSRFPHLLFECGEIDIQIHAGSEDRDNIKFIYRSNRRHKNSFEKLRQISQRLNISIKMAEYKNNAYARTEDMKKKIPIDQFDSIFNKLNSVIEQIK